MYTDFFEQELNFASLDQPEVTFDEENLFGALLDTDLAKAHVTEDPLIKHYAAANHFLDYNMSLRRTRLSLKIKFFFKDMFGKKPKAKKPLGARAKRKKARKK